MISSSQRPLPDNTRHSQQTNIHAPGGIRTQDLSRRAALPLRFNSAFKGLRTAGSQNLFKYRVGPRSKHSVSVIQTSQLILYREIIAVCSQIHTKHINTLCGQNVKFVNVKCSVRTAQWTHSVSVIQTSQLMLYREIMAVCSEIHEKHINTLCGQNVNVNLGWYKESSAQGTQNF